MTASTTPRFDPRIALPRVVSAGLLSALVAASMLVALPQETGSSARLEMRTVVDTGHPCVNLREGPSYDARVIGCVETGSVVTVSGYQDGWSRVSSEAAGEGWMGTRLLNAPEGGRTAPAPTSSAPATDSDALAAELASAQERIVSLENELTRATLANDDSSLLEETRAERDQLRTLLAEAEGRIAVLESELASTRSAWGQTAQEQGELTERIAQLTVERDSLAGELTRAEARQLYLQNDLEETRAELMQLKGIPPTLVLPEPEPVAPSPVPVASPDEQSASAAPEPLPGSDLYRTEEVVAMVRAWAQAWSEQRVDDYLEFYAPTFRPADGLDRASWESSRRERVAAPRSIDISLDQLSPTLSGESAIVLFRQTYTSDSFSDVVSKTLVLELIDGAWRIVGERVND